MEPQPLRSSVGPGAQTVPLRFGPAQIPLSGGHTTSVHPPRGLFELVATSNGEYSVISLSYCKLIYASCMVRASCPVGNDASYEVLIETRIAHGLLSSTHYTSSRQLTSRLAFVARGTSTSVFDLPCLAGRSAQEIPIRLVSHSHVPGSGSHVLICTTLGMSPFPIGPNVDLQCKSHYCNRVHIS